MKDGDFCPLGKDTGVWKNGVCVAQTQSSSISKSIKIIYDNKIQLKYTMAGFFAGAVLSILKGKDAGTTFGWGLIGGLGGAVIGKLKTFKID